MNKKTTLLSILQNDSWTALAIGAFFATLAATLIILVVSPYVQEAQAGYAPFFSVMSVGVFIAAVIISILRVRYVNQFLAAGVSVKAQVAQSSIYKSNLRLTLRYTYLAQAHEIKVNQVITGKTKKLLQQSEVDLVIDPQNPERVLIGDVYF